MRGIAERRTAPRWKRDLGALAGIVGLYALMQLLHITCPIRALTGISCAGCGMTRAWLSLLRLDIAAAFRYHPLVLLPIPAALLLLFRARLNRTVVRVGVGVVCAAFLIVYFVRLLILDDPIVVWAPTQGLIWRAASRMLGWQT